METVTACEEHNRQQMLILTVSHPSEGKRQDVVQHLCRVKTGRAADVMRDGI